MPVSKIKKNNNNNCQSPSASLTWGRGLRPRWAGPSTASAWAELKNEGAGQPFGRISELAGARLAALVGVTCGFSGRDLRRVPKGTLVCRGWAWLEAPRDPADSSVPGRAWRRRGRSQWEEPERSSGSRRSPNAALVGALPWEAVCLGPHAAPHLVLITG